MNITEILVPAQEIAWLPWAVQYFFYIGSSYAAAILFVIALLLKNQTSHSFRSALVLVMAIGAIVGPLALTGDLHQPGRAWHFYAHLTPWSWMSLGSIFLPIFSGLTVITAWLYLRNDIAKLRDNSNLLLRKLAWLTLGNWQVSAKQLLVVAITTAISGLTIALYTGAEIAVIESRSLWNQPASPLIWFVTSFLAAVGLTLFVWRLFPSGQMPIEKALNEKVPSEQKKLTTCDTKILRNTIGLSGVLALILVPIWASNNLTFSLYQDSQWIANIAMMTTSLLGCFVLSFMVSRLTATWLGCAALSFTTLTAAWVTRWVTMMEVQTIPRFDAGSYPYELPLNGSGLLGIIGMIGLWLALALFASEVVSTRTPSSLSKSNPMNSH
ncbi:polysulfide reductase NrfD [Vibrio lamellibrachiae]|uniref:NrfD/PsrC family molybdoenzyme membrane anchor subunit n=1 Tax=Vibrio lamellibrachiae TaxID=2910253 RepID=UPI003D0C7EF0